jgi:hypothetical protein
VKGGSGVASGLVLLLAGVFVVLRTVRRPDGGRNLVDLVMGANATAGNGASNSTNNEPAIPSLKHRLAPAPHVRAPHAPPNVFNTPNLLAPFQVAP